MRLDLALAPLFVLLAAGDCVTTHLILQRGGREANPIYGPHPSSLKVAVAHLLVVCVVLGLAHAMPHIRVLLLSLGVAIYGAVTVWNLIVLRKLGAPK